MASTQTSENSLKRAEEFIAVGNTSSALQVLLESISARWFHHNFDALDRIVFKYVELAVELRKGTAIKECLLKYRAIVQGTDVDRLEGVIGHLLGLCEQKISLLQGMGGESEASTASTQRSDLNDSFWDEVLAFGRVDAKNSASNVSPSLDSLKSWMRFVFECFKSSLDLLRQNQTYQKLYTKTVQRAFSFCQKYERKVEFRKLCELIRYHFSLILKYPEQSGGIVISNTTSHHLFLELCFEQLSLATKMELWQEAFKTIEDIHCLFLLARKSAKPELIASYYHHLCKIFQKSKNFVLMSLTLCKIFKVELAKYRKSEEKSTDKLEYYANLAILCVSAIPLLNNNGSNNGQQHRHQNSNLSVAEMDSKSARLNDLLGVTSSPTRESLIKDIVALNMEGFADENFVLLFRSLASFKMLSSSSQNTIKQLNASKIAASLALLSSSGDLEYFKDSIQENVATLILSNVSVEHGKIAISELDKIMNTFGFTLPNFEKFLFSSCNGRDFNFCIDHAKQMIFFKKSQVSTSLEAILNVSGNKSISLLKNINQLLVELKLSVPSNDNAMMARFDALKLNSLQKLGREHNLTLQRKAKIDKNREIMEAAKRQKEKDELRERALKAKADAEIEAKRLEEDTKRRALAKRKIELENIKQDQLRKRAEEEKQRALAAENRANLEKFIAVLTRFDHLERAFRQEEVKLMNEDISVQKQENLAAYNEKIALIKSQAEAQHSRKVKQKHQFQRLDGDIAHYVQKMRDIKKKKIDALIAQNKIKFQDAKEEYRLKQIERKKQMEQKDLQEQARRAEETKRNIEIAKQAPQETLIPAKKSYIAPHLRKAAENNNNNLESSIPNRASSAQSWRRQNN